MRVLGDARVDDVHRAHRAARVVEHPFRAVRVERYGALAYVAVRLETMCEIMPAVLFGDAARAESWSSWRWTGLRTYHRSCRSKWVFSLF